MAVYDNRICRTCGRIFEGGPRAWYCPECRRERERERKKRYNRGEFNRHIGDIDKCQNCGKEYIIEAGTQKYCRVCRPLMAKKIDNEQGTAYYYNIVKKDLKKRSEKRKVYRQKNKEKIRQQRRFKNNLKKNQEDGKKGEEA